jgi:4a-hydroxytetrahydrobiopterin dehydratase
MAEARGAARVAAAVRESHVEGRYSNREGCMTLLDDTAIRDGLDRLDGWTRDGMVIRKTYTLASFAEAIAFVNRIAELAARADHHPDIDIRYDRVGCALSTHSEGGLTQKDLDLARQLDAAR